MSDIGRVLVFHSTRGGWWIRAYFHDAREAYPARLPKTWIPSVGFVMNNRLP